VTAGWCARRKACWTASGSRFRPTSSSAASRSASSSWSRPALRGTRFLIFDEPTAYLTRTETTQLFALIRRLKAEHVTLVYISHRMEEVFELSDRVSVLRDGAMVGTWITAETDETALIRAMSARTIEQIYHKEAIPHGEVLLRTRGLGGQGFADISLAVRRGEIVGLYGLIGAGRSEFVQSVFGRFPATSGEIVWKDAVVRNRHVRDAIDRGIALVPESRRDQGLCLNLTVGTNLNLTILGRLSRGPMLDAAAERKAAERQMADLRIVTAGRAAPAASLSGGNQQKIVVGKWLAHGAELLIFDEPTAGVDVATKVEIYRLFATLLRAGAGIILISSYLPEVYELADTLHVFRRGGLVASHAQRTATMEQILTEAIG